MAEYVIIVAALGVIASSVAWNLGPSISANVEDAADAVEAATRVGIPTGESIIHPSFGSLTPPTTSILDLYPALTFLPGTSGDYRFSLYTVDNPPPPPREGLDPGEVELFISKFRGPARGFEWVRLTGMTSVGEGGRFTVTIFDDANPPPPSQSIIGTNWLMLSDSVTGRVTAVSLN